MRVNRALLFAALSILSLPARTHQDTILTVRDDGSMPELPLQYSSARLKINLSAAPRNNYPLTLQFGGKEYRLPRCAFSPIKTKALSMVRVSGSWYHQARLSGLPHYILVHFSDPVQPKDVAPSLGVDYLFNLESPNLMKIEKLERYGPRSISYQELSIDVLCGRAKAKK